VLCWVSNDPHGLVTISSQIDFLTALGARLDHWTSPGDAEDVLTGAEPLWDAFAKKYLPAPARVGDVLLSRWVMIKDFRTQRPLNFLLNPAQRDFSRNRTSRNIICKAGRAGFTTLEAMRALLRTVCNRGLTSILVTYRRESAEDYFTQVQFAFDHLAGNLGLELRKSALRTKGPGAKDNARELYFPEMNSRFFVDTAGQYAPAEGESIQTCIADEVARWRVGNPKQVVATLLSHITGDNTEATLMSRPFGQTGEFYERYWAARRGESTFRAHFYSWVWNPSQASKPPADFEFTEEERAVTAKYRNWRAQQAPANCGLPAELSTAKLQWRRDGRSELRDLFEQEFAEDEHGCFLGSGNCPFDAHSIDIVLNDLTPVLERQGGRGESENGLLVWRKPDPEHWYVLFIDPAGTLHKSRAAMQVIDGVTAEQAAEWVGRCDAATLGGIALDIAKRYGKVLIAPEMNMGAISGTVVAALVEAGVPMNSEGWPRFSRSRDSGGQWRLGWNTEKKNRDEMLDNFAVLWRDAPQLFHSARLANEVKSAVRAGDKIMAGDGMTDDLLIAAAGAHKVRMLESVAVKEPYVAVINLEKRIPESERGWVRMAG
jgi:hypothetical protein